MNPEKTRRIFARLLSILLALAFLLAGLPKLFAVSAWIEKFARWGYPRWLLLLIGLVEVAGAILILIPRDAVYGVWLLIAVMLGATYTHVANGEGLAVLRPLIFIFFLFLLGWLRRVPRDQTQTT
jgi:putative oxidoreductase